jgi:hypothetical protein
VLTTSPFQNIWNRVNQVQVRLKDKYRGKPYFPIGTLKPIQTYDPEKDIPESELYFFKLDTTAPNNASSICMIGMSGTQKTTLIKTMTYYNSLLPNTRIGIIDLKGKSIDWDKCNYAHKNKGMLYPNEPTTLRVRAGCPLFALRGMPDNEKRRTRRMNLDPQEFADINVLTGLGFSPIAKQHIYKMLSEKLTPQQILEKTEEMYKKRKLTKPSYDNMSILLDNMVRAGFLAKKDYFDINELWDADYNWALGFNNKEVPFLSVYVDKLLTKVFDRANSNKGRTERYWIVVDDCFKAFGLPPEKYPSVQTGVDSVTQWRSVGVNMVFGIQSPTMLNEEIYGDIKHFFIYRCANPATLYKYIPNKQIVDNIRTLTFQPERFISECIHVFPDRFRFQRFYPFNSPIAN